MLGKIAELPPDVVSKIAAGEVVERPASVVKELIENSIDASSTKIRIYLERGGKELIKVVDNGEGILSEDVELAFRRHATSKISSLDDIRRLTSLGFRGEALPSIAEVSKVELITRARGEGSGTRILLEGGRIVKKEEGFFPEGTSVSVRSLFYNLSLRRRILKSDSAEWNKALKVVIAYILAFPSIKFFVYKDGELFLSSGKNLDESLREIFGEVFLKGKREISLERERCKVSGAVSIVPEGAGELFIIVNGRPVRDKLIRKAIIDALSIPPGRFPIKGFLKVEAPPDLLDQNVHPAKLEVRFFNPQEIYSLVKSAVMRAFSIEKSSRDFPETSAPVAFSMIERDKMGFPVGLKETLFEYDSFKAHPKSQIRVLARSSRGYFVAESPKGIAIVDPHAVAERLIFEKLKSMRSVVQLVMSIPIQLDVYTAALLRDKVALFKEIGFDIEEFGKNVYLLRGVPSPLSDLNINWPEAIKSLLKEGSLEISKAWADLACHAAPKLGAVKSVEELQALLDELAEFGDFELCPHGRPLIYLISYEDIERWMKR